MREYKYYQSLGIIHLKFKVPISENKYKFNKLLDAENYK